MWYACQHACATAFPVHGVHGVTPAIDEMRRRIVSTSGPSSAWAAPAVAASGSRKKPGGGLKLKSPIMSPLVGAGGAGGLPFDVGPLDPGPGGMISRGWRSPDCCAGP